MKLSWDGYLSTDATVQVLPHWVQVASPADPSTRMVQIHIPAWTWEEDAPHLLQVLPLEVSQSIVDLHITNVHAYIAALLKQRNHGSLPTHYM
jgi:hypothetical protein